MIAAWTTDGVYRKSKFELDELYWFVGKKANTKTRENVYIMTMISPKPRQIQVFRVARDKSAWRIQEMVDSVPKAKKYCSDGYHGYLDVDYYVAEHIRICRDKSDTHNVETINADLRYFIPGLARRSRCFFRSLETLQAALHIFVEAYNKFGEYKLKYRRPIQHRPGKEHKHLHHYKGFALLYF